MRKVLIFNDTSRYQHYGCDLVMESLFRNLRARGQQPVSVHRVGTSVEKRFDRIIRQHPDASLVVVNGEGVIHDDRRHALGLAALGKRCADVGLPAFLVNAALFNNSAALYRDLAHYRAVYVRDGESQREAGAHGIDACRVPDLSFDGVAQLAALPSRRSGLLVTDSVTPALTADLSELAHQSKARWVAMQRRVPVPFGALRRVGARRFVRQVAGAERVLTGRFHCVTVSIATRTPFIALASNTRKIEALLLDVFGNERCMAALPTAMAERLQGGEPSFGDGELQAIEAYLKRGRIETAQMFDALAG